MDKKRCLIFTVIIILFAGNIFLWFLGDLFETQQEYVFRKSTQLLDRSESLSEEKKPLVLLLWLRPGADVLKWFSRFWVKSFPFCQKGKQLNSKAKCCYTTQRDMLPASDVVIFRGLWLEAIEFPKRMHPGQKWVFWENEPPTKVIKRVNLSKYNGMFNITATYSLDSTVTRPDYLRKCLRMEDQYEKLRKINYAKNKSTKVFVAWFASRCKSQSKREIYVQELRKYIKVDVYGRCGALKCGLKGWRGKFCFRKLLHGQNSYKFYLAFENSLCKDYVTEKLWVLSNLDVVPVVLGAINYSRMLPKDSFIDVNDFSSPKHLAEYLIFLNSNDEIYNNYIRNKNSLRCQFITQPPIMWEHRLCDYIDGHIQTRQVIENLDLFWGMSKCVSPELYYKGSFIHTFI